MKGKTTLYSFNLDKLDARSLKEAITEWKRRPGLDAHGKPIVADGDSDENGAILCECLRSFLDYRELLDVRDRQQRQHLKAKQSVGLPPWVPLSELTQVLADDGAVLIVGRDPAQAILVNNRADLQLLHARIDELLQALAKKADLKKRAPKRAPARKKAPKRTTHARSKSHKAR